MPELAWVNGDIKPASEAVIPVVDGGFLVGYGVFEVVRAYGGRPFRLEPHLDRMERSAEVMRLQLMPRGELRKAILETLARSGIEEAEIRIPVSAVSQFPPHGDEKAATNTTILVRNLPPVALQPGPRTAIVCSVRRLSSNPVCRAKTLSYADNVAALMEALAAGADEALMLTTDGLLSEATNANVFLVVGEDLVTPCLDCGCLAGITRMAVIEIAADSGLRVREEQVRPEALFEADEVFVTSTLREVMPLSAINGRPVNNTESPKGWELRFAFKELVKRELGLG